MKHGIFLNCNANDTVVCLSVKSFSDNFYKTKVLVLGAHVGRSKLSDYTVTLSVSSCQQVMVIIDSKHSF